MGDRYFQNPYVLEDSKDEISKLIDKDGQVLFTTLCTFFFALVLKTDSKTMKKIGS